MKKSVSIFLIILTILIIPCSAFLFRQSKNEDKASNSNETEQSVEEIVFKLYHHDTGEVEEINSIDYVKGVVAAEMPVTFESEALKAQAVAAHTYAIRRYLQALENPNSDMNGAQISTDSSTFQAYASKEELMETYGSDFGEKWNKISEAVDSVSNTIITYENEPIVAAYHSMSGGVTESAETVWGQDVPYLQAVDSQTDTQQDNYINTMTYSKQQVQEILESNSAGQLSDDPSGWFVIESHTDSGYVNQVTVGEQTFTGVQIRTLFQLKSANFEISFSDDTFTFTTKGYGHGIGMSQYGANELAKQGYTYEEILTHYYSGVTLSTLNDLDLFG